MKPLFGCTVLLLTLFLIVSCKKSEKSKLELLVSTEWLEQHLDDPGIVILTVGEREEYDSLHIPGTQWIYLWDLVIDTDSLENEIPPLHDIESVLEAKGISDDSRIVLYYDNDTRINRTCRIFMTLDYAGLGDRTFLLNGGLVKWTGEGRITSTDTVEAATGDLTLRESAGFLTDAYDIMNYMDNPEYKILDARPADHYMVEYDPDIDMNDEGHIMGAESMPFEQMFNEASPYLFKDLSDIQELFDKTGVKRNQTIIHYCNTGFWATGNYLLAKQLGYKSLFYDGSFDDWKRLGLPAIQPVKNPG